MPNPVKVQNIIVGVLFTGPELIQDKRKPLALTIFGADHRKWFFTHLGLAVK